MSTKGPRFSLFDILQQNECLKIPKGPFFRFFWHYETVIKILFFSFFRKFFKDSKESPFNFLKFCNRMDIKKSQRAPFYSFVRNFKMNNFVLKFRFSQAQHAISDFCFFFQRPVFFLCDFFFNLFHRSPSSIFARNETFCES